MISLTRPHKKSANPHDEPNKKIEFIRQAQKGLLTPHFKLRMKERRVTLGHVFETMNSGKPKSRSDKGSIGYFSRKFRIQIVTCAYSGVAITTFQDNHKPNPNPNFLDLDTIISDQPQHRMNEKLLHSVKARLSLT